MSYTKSSEEVVLSTDNTDHRFVQVGRICLVVYGNHYRKLVVIVDFIDRTRVLVDGAAGALSNIKRISFPIRWLQCTKFRINIHRDIELKDLQTSLKKVEIKKNWAESNVGRRNACIAKRDALNDFGRFKLYYVKGKFKKKVAAEVLKLRAEQINKKKKTKKVTVALLRAQKRRRLDTHPVLRRVVGRFHRKLKSRVIKKQRQRKTRLKRHSKATGYTARYRQPRKQKQQQQQQQK